MILSYELEEQRKKPENYFHNTTIGVNPYRTQLLKWIGNKQRVAHEIISFFPKRFGTYFEPFVGSSAVLSVLSPKKGEASDSFAPLIAIWQTLKTNPDLLKLWYRDRWHELQNGEKVKQYEKIKSRYNAEKKPAD